MNGTSAQPSPLLPRCAPQTPSSRHIANLARSTRRNVLASGAGLTTCNRDTGPSPPRARSLSAKYVHIRTRAGDRTLDVGERKTSDGNPGSRSARGRAILVILLYHNTVLSDAGKSDILVGNARDGSSGVIDSLYADTVLGVLDCAGGDGDGLDGVVRASANGADGETMAAGAGSSCESDAGSGVDGEAVVLIDTGTS